MKGAPQGLPGPRSSTGEAPSPGMLSLAQFKLCRANMTWESQREQDSYASSSCRAFRHNLARGDVAAGVEQSVGQEIGAA